MLNKDEELEYKALLACIKQYYGCYPTGLMFKQIQRFHDNNKWSYKNIRLCLQYINDFTDIEFNKKYGLGILPYYYDAMIEYYKEKIKKQNEIQQSKKKSKYVKVNKKKSDIHKFNKQQMIDIEGIGFDDE